MSFGFPITVLSVASADLSAGMGGCPQSQESRHHTALRREGATVDRYPETCEPRNHTALRWDSVLMEGQCPETWDLRNHTAPK